MLPLDGAVQTSAPSVLQHLYCTISLGTKNNFERLKAAADFFGEAFMPKGDGYPNMLPALSVSRTGALPDAAQALANRVIVSLCSHLPEGERDETSTPFSAATCRNRNERFRIPVPQPS